MSHINEELLALAKNGEMDKLFQALEKADDVEELPGLTYQWATIAGYYGSEEGDAMADDIYEAELNRGGDEYVSMLHFNVAEWFCFGEGGLPKDEGLILEQLKFAEDFGFSKNFQDIDKLLKEVRAQLSPEGQKSVDQIFPGL